MKDKLILTAIIFIWLALTAGIGTLSLNVFKSMTDFITVKDIIGCYFIPLVIIGAIMVRVLINKL